MKLMPIAFLAILLIGPKAGAASPLELVTLQYPPYEFEEAGKVRGIAADIVREVFKRMDQPITIKLLPWARALKYIEIGKADAIFTAYKTPEREVFADYSRQVLMPQIVSLFVKKNTAISFDGDLAGLSQYRFGVVRMVSYGSIFDDAVKTGVISRIDPADTGENNMEKLLGNRFDILVSNKYGALYILKKMNKLDEVRELRPELQRVPSYIAFSKKRNLTAVRDRFDAILLEMIADGSYETIIEAYVTR